MPEEKLETVDLTPTQLLAVVNYSKMCVVRSGPAGRYPFRCKSDYPDCHLCNLALSDHKVMAAVLPGAVTKTYSAIEQIFTENDVVFFDHYGDGGGIVSCRIKTR
jgi:hypothetical protein